MLSAEVTILFHFSKSISKSSCISFSVCPSASVLTITPIPTGFKRFTTDFKRALSLAEVIFLLTLTPTSFGISTKKRPGRDISVVTRGPLCPVGSLTTCTTIFCFGFNLSCNEPLPVTS